jgi:hypothetical protein
MKPTLKEDWGKVHGLAVDIANAVGRGRAVVYERTRIAMLRVLRRLEKRHGPHPSIIATKADYLLRRADRIGALERALKMAIARGDALNIDLVSEDLRELRTEKSASARRPDRSRDVRSIHKPGKGGVSRDSAGGR